MLSYKDKTFCTDYTKCKHGKECHRALTADVIKGANDAEMPVAQFIGKPQCYEEES